MTVQQLRRALECLPGEMLVFTIDAKGDLVRATETSYMMPQDIDPRDLERTPKGYFVIE